MLHAKSPFAFAATSGTSLNGSNRLEHPVNTPVRATPVGVAPAPIVARRTATASDRSTIRMDFAVDDKTAHNLRLMVHSFVLMGTGDRTLAGRISLAVAQMVENAQKRSRAPRYLLQLHCVPSGSVSVELSNEATEGEVLGLRKALETVNRPTPAEAYSQALLGTDPEAEGRLCLARVRYEGQLQLSMWKDGTRVVLVADT